MATFCILCWRILWMTMLNRFTRSLEPTMAFAPLEIKLLNRLVPEPINPGVLAADHC
jgi:hypothetical protein